MSAKVEKKTGKRGATYWLIVHEGGKRQRKSYQGDKAAADKAAKEINRRLRDGAFRIAAKPEGPTLRAFAVDYLANRIDHLSERERRGRRGKLANGGPILSALGDHHLTELTGDVLLRWVETDLRTDAKGNPRSRGTLTHYVNALASVLRYARARKLIWDDPMAELRLMLSEETRTKAGRAARNSQANPIDAEALAALLGAARSDRGKSTYPIVLTLLDCGVRLGELRGLTWGQVAWGDDAGNGRHLLIDRSIPSGLHTPEPTKSGYSRKVQLSRRLRATLLEWFVSQGQPGADVPVFPGLDGDNFRRREWADLCGKKGAGIGHHQIKSLRDSFASLLLTSGIPLAFVAKQLGHQSMQLTERHYAAYMRDGDEYQAPEPLAEGEVPADILARLTDGSIRPETSQGAEPNPTGTDPRA